MSDPPDNPTSLARLAWRALKNAREAPARAERARAEAEEAERKRIDEAVRQIKDALAERENRYGG